MTFMSVFLSVCMGGSQETQKLKELEERKYDTYTKIANACQL